MLIDSMEALNLIERRIDILEQTLGCKGDGDNKGDDLTEALLSANTLLASAMSGREQINAIVLRASELEKYLDPMFLDEKQDVKAKEVYVNAVAPEMAAAYEMLEQIKALQGTLSAEYFRNLEPLETAKLSVMKEVAGELAKQNDLVEERLIQAMQVYSETQKTMIEALVKLETQVGNLEAKTNTKNVDRNL